MDKLAKLIGYRIKEVRKQKGLRQEDMESFGINYRYYQKIEGGQANITLGTIEKVAEALDLDAKEFFLLPLSESEEVNELATLLKQIIGRKDPVAIKKLNIFIKYILG